MKAQKLVLFMIGFVLFVVNPIRAQEKKLFIVPDSLKRVSYNAIYSRIEKNGNKPNQKLYYARVYLGKAESENYIKEIITGYGMLAAFSDYEIGIQYADKMS
jgi:hypothetical protein